MIEVIRDVYVCWIKKYFMFSLLYNVIVDVVKDYFVL